MNVLKSIQRIAPLVAVTALGISSTLLTGCTGMVDMATAKDTSWVKAGGTMASLQADYRVCHGLAARQFANDVSLVKEASIHAAALQCVHDEKGWDQSPNGFVIPAHGFE